MTDEKGEKKENSEGEVILMRKSCLTLIASADACGVVWFIGT